MKEWEDKIERKMKILNGMIEMLGEQIEKQRKRVRCR